MKAQNEKEKRAVEKRWAAMGQPGTEDRAPRRVLAVAQRAAG